MLHLKKIAQSSITALFRDLRSAIVAVSFAALIAGGGGLFLFVESIRHSLIETLQKPSPLWAAIALALIVILYTYLKARSFQPPPKMKPKIEFLTVDKIKWKITIYDSGQFEIDKMPYCAEHDMQFIESVSNSACPNFGTECSALVRNKDIHNAITHVERIVESKIRNGVKLC